MSITPGQQLMKYLAKADLLNKVAIARSIVQKTEQLHNAILAQRDSMHPSMQMDFIEIVLESSINLRERRDELQDLEQQLKYM